MGVSRSVLAEERHSRKVLLTCSVRRKLRCLTGFDLCGHRVSTAEKVKIHAAVSLIWMVGVKSDLPEELQQESLDLRVHFYVAAQF